LATQVRERVDVLQSSTILTGLRYVTGGRWRSLTLSRPS